MPSSNSNMTKAKSVKDDEFYTKIESIEEELAFYPPDTFRDKIVYSNCDSDWSAFVKYFKSNGDRLGIKDFIHTSDDFSAQHNLDILKRADIVMSNPPFSLFRRYYWSLIWAGCEYLVIGNAVSTGYRDITPHFISGKSWLGATPRISAFTKPDGTEAGVNATWFTNIEHSRRKEIIPLTCEYDPEKYPKFDKYDAINVNKTRDIPKDYDGLMGVPISFLCHHNPSQFDLIDIYTQASIKGELMFSRAIIQRRTPSSPPLKPKESLRPHSMQASFAL